jgi:hypothetical protein
VEQRRGRVRDGGSAASLLQHGGRSFTGPSGPGRASRGLVCSRCYVPVNDRLSGGGGGFLQRGCEAAVPRPMMSCVFALQAACQCHEATDDGDYKIVVVHAGGWYS